MLHVQIGLGTKFKKQIKTEKVSINIESCIFELV